MTSSATTIGPFETERDAWQTGMKAESNQDMLMAACEAAGVELGAWDRRILAWLAGYEPATCAVIAGVISLANLDGSR